uniref:NADH-ubiquinone oxidoreductase chain 4L n=1 Tax=Nectoneanthes multignatha TaxID=3070695 RepID=A0AA50IEY7_9ANNE|nr:NADH dehydrogenase subunit 4L [Nectoneanthes uchiwa]YP_010944257.1 NADH dehydrogenase subunit 4L [Nectoneanthes multignatha]WLW41610.1 NADH dehydrogenase subunit 4L [Nectoneanthes uchiwa]WLW41623.1 NADH dehydrogenase subunit 4L [Nectoneanthes multignatha]
MTSWMIMISPMFVLMSLTCVIMQRNHLLMALLALEAMILGLIIMIIIMTNSSWLMFIITILTFGACEASLGLACMTAMSRSYGNDHINSLNINKC